MRTILLPNAPRPLDGPPMQMLTRLATEGRAAIGGAFLARSGRDVFNTFVLALPTGEVFSHDKDFPDQHGKLDLCRRRRRRGREGDRKEGRL